ncbi:hypothetical protein [Nocardia grenadensis]|uniref:hypothetical protein n=1 Tax=Nocardia grenadensis TaxID=931537 RepID=UPI0007A3F3BA|nr:hypothetical protein [Nocardia grenadensis]
MLVGTGHEITIIDATRLVFLSLRTLAALADDSAEPHGIQICLVIDNARLSRHAATIAGHPYQARAIPGAQPPPSTSVFRLPPPRPASSPHPPESIPRFVANTAYYCP